MPHADSAHGLRVQLATALREAEELRDAADTWLSERDALRAEVGRLREALGRAKMQVGAIKPTRASAETLRVIDAALAGGGDRG